MTEAGSGEQRPNHAPGIISGLQRVGRENSRTYNVPASVTIASQMAQVFFGPNVFYILVFPFFQ